MATSTNSYASVDHVESLIGDMVAERQFSVSSIPTRTQVEQIIDTVAAEINVALAAASYSAPLSTSSDPITYKWLESVNAWGVAAQVISTVPAIAITLDQEDAANNRAQSYQRLYDRALKRIDDQKISASRATSRLGRVYSGSPAGGPGRSDG